MSKFLLKEIFDDAFGAGWDADTIHGASLNALYDALTGGAIEHGWLGGLGDDDHAQYALLAGRAGGQNLSLGLGLTAPLEPLHIYMDDAAHRQATIEQDGAGAAGLRFLRTGLKAFVLGLDGASRFIISDGSSFGINDRFCIATDGKIGLGTVTPSDALDVEGGGIVLGDESAEGTSHELKIYGYRTGDALRSLEIGVGVDATDTASFDGLANYRFDGTIKPVGSIVFQTAATSLDLATNGAYFLLRRLSQEAEPTPAAGELLVWYKPTGGRVRLVYNDADAGVVATQLI